MVTPRREVLRVPSGASAHFGRTAAWHEQLPSSGWVALPNSTLSASGVGWAGVSPGGSSTYTAIVTAWGGGVLNTVGVLHEGVFYPGTFLVIWGGGHGDYAGNELLAYGPLQSSQPRWRRLTDPTLPAPVNMPRSAGRPVSRHTYDSLVYLPTENRMLAIGAAGYYSQGYAFNVADVFDFGSNTWSTADEGFPAFNGGGTGTISLLSGYDSATGKAWALGHGNSQRLGSYLSGSWSSVPKDNPAGPVSGKAALGRGMLVFGSGSTVYAQDLSAPETAIYQPACTGAAPPAAAIKTLDWDEAGGRFMAVNAASGQLHTLTPGPRVTLDPWVWATLPSVDGTLPAQPVQNGVYGRFRFSTGDRTVPPGVVYMPAHNAPIYFRKL